MLSSTHTAIGLAAAAGVCAAASPDAFATMGCLAASVVGSQLPDADQRGSKVHRLSYTERRNALLAVIGLLARLPLRAMVLFKHRGPTHWMTTGVLISAAATVAALALAPVAAFSVGAGLTCGYVLHTLADACTPAGSPLLGPFDTRQVHLLPEHLRMHTGGPADIIVGVAAMCLAAGFLTLAV